MWSRLAFLRSTGVLGATALTARGNGVEAIVEAAQSVADRTPEEVAPDEFFWREIQSGFTLDRTLPNLNTGNSSPTRPRVSRLRPAKSSGISQIRSSVPLTSSRNSSPKPVR